MAVAGILTKSLHAAAKPKERPEVKTDGLENLDKKTALILYAVAEAVLGEGFLKKAPTFIETVDDYLNYQRPGQRELFRFALLFAEVRVVFDLISVGKLRGFSHLSLDDRRKVLEKLRSSTVEQNRNIYAAFVNVSAATYYASELTWPDIGYTGVSVDHPEILNHPPPVPWRRDDPRPIEP
jgi:hypothetical protein